MGFVLNPNLTAEKPNKMCHALLTTRILVNPNIDALKPYLVGFQSTEVISHTLANTTQMAKAIHRYPLRRHIRSRFPQANRPCLKEKVATDTLFASCRAIVTRATCAQVFYGITSHIINVYGMPSENGAPDAYNDFLWHEGCPPFYVEINHVSNLASGSKNSTVCI